MHLQLRIVYGEGRGPSTDSPSMSPLDKAPFNKLICLAVPPKQNGEIKSKKYTD
jgi:hypothetical protein